MSLAETALLNIDMQRGFCDPEGYAAQVGMDVSHFEQPVFAKSCEKAGH
ncbi:MAG: nicotinamidase-related amidase [Cellvibrionaceae bacterium]|jgi:nicotinamidase-related amidase